MALEYRDLERKDTFTAVPLAETKGAFVVPLMWVYSYKFDTDGFLKKFKARLVVRGDLQRSKNEETYAATLAARVFRALMAIAAYFDLDIWQFDAINAFTNSKIDELVYVKCPEGYDQQGYCLQLNRALYGLTRSPLLWFNDLSSKLEKMDLKQVPEAQCLFVNRRLIVFFYVDDICVLVHPSEHDAYETFRTLLLREYEMREMGELKWFLGIRILRDRTNRKLWLCQDSYVDKVVSTYGLESTKTKDSNANGGTTPF
jgi:hypothetical protein